MRFRTCLLAAMIVMISSSARADFVRNMDVQIKVLSDASLDVTETIEVMFESPRHGIYRFVPVRYERYGNPFTVEFRLDSITDENGRSLHYSRARQGRDVSMKIGDKDVTITGAHTYRIHYTVRRAVNFFGESPEVYWNATGDQWPYRIERATATLVPPAGVNASDIRTASFVGPPGSTAPGAVDVRDDSIVFSAAGIISPGSGLTIVAGLPAGSVTRPTLAQNLWWFIKDLWPVAIFPLIAALIAVIVWHRTGRDEGAGTQAVAVEFAPPTGLSPAEVGTLIDERCDTPDIVATLIDLAARGWLTIREVESQKILFLSSHDYEFARTDPPPSRDTLKPHERKFLDGLFAASDVTRLSDQKEKFYRHIDPIRRSIWKELMTAKLFKRPPETVRAMWITLGVFLIVGGVFLAIVIERNRSFGIGLALAGLVFAIWSRAMPARTQAGTRKLIESLSFKRFVEMVEKDRIKEMAGNDPTIFGRLLPYAMVLGVADRWAEVFAGIMTVAPQWYQSSDGRAFNSWYFVNNLGSGMRTMQRTLTSAPQAKAGSGGSGFSGGSSGGGFGGGGGGSW